MKECPPNISREFLLSNLLEDVVRLVYTLYKINLLLLGFFKLKLDRPTKTKLRKSGSGYKP